MNLAFIILVILSAIGVWASLSFLFPIIGKTVSELINDILDQLND